MQVKIEKIAAWAPGIESPKQWQQWALGEHHYNGDTGKPKPAKVPAMMRRRLTLWGAMALEVACQCAEDIDATTPTIFASRHGDTERTYKLLEAIAEEEPLSPTAFSLSVHNSSSGIFSIVEKVLANALAIAAGKETLGHAFLEAQNLLSQGHKKVLLVMAEQTLAEFYQADADENEIPHAAAMVLSLRDEPSLDISFSAKSQAQSADTYESMSLQFLKFWHTEQNQLSYTGHRLNWLFKR